MIINDSEKTALTEIGELDAQLKAKYSDKLEVNHNLDRTLVSFQANRKENGHNWCKFKEGFSAALMRYVFKTVGLSSGLILDPFAGSGTALFVAAEAGMDAEGIELLPSSAEIIEIRNLLNGSDKKVVAKKMRDFAKLKIWLDDVPRLCFKHLRITQGAFSQETEIQLEKYLYRADRLRNKVLSRVLRFAALCILESISYTRKDGQCLRWDHRSSRRNGSNPFDKGLIMSFTKAIELKLGQIANDLDLQPTLFDGLSNKQRTGKISLQIGSCLDILPNLKGRSFDGLITSPPYCNRYDYTRTYALELAMLGVDEDEIKNLRQTMLSCTVENREKETLSLKFDRSVYEKSEKCISNQVLLQRILSYLEQSRKDKRLNNSGIPRMVRNYFREMSLVIFESIRILKPGAPFIMVNDNVRYQGASIPVDLILSNIAKSAGYVVDAIWVLPKGKGNSSQQMGLHGREEIRKCVYIWRKPKDRRANKQVLGPAREL